MQPLLHGGIICQDQGNALVLLAGGNITTAQNAQKMQISRYGCLHFAARNARKHLR